MAVLRMCLLSLLRHRYLQHRPPVLLLRPRQPLLLPLLSLRDSCCQRWTGCWAPMSRKLTTLHGICWLPASPPLRLVCAPPTSTCSPSTGPPLPIRSPTQMHCDGASTPTTELLCISAPPVTGSWPSATRWNTAVPRSPLPHPLH